MNFRGEKINSQRSCHLMEVIQLDGINKPSLSDNKSYAFFFPALSPGQKKLVCFQDLHITSCDVYLISFILWGPIKLRMQFTRSLKTFYLYIHSINTFLKKWSTRADIVNDPSISPWNSPAKNCYWVFLSSLPERFFCLFFIFLFWFCLRSISACTQGKLDIRYT